MTATIEARVRRGALLLDAHKPGWAAEIRTEQLDMQDCVGCTIGQVFGYYTEGCNRLGITHSGWNTQAAGYGFHSAVPCPSFDETPPEGWQEYRAAEQAEYAALAAAWLVEIRARLSPAPVEPTIPATAWQSAPHMIP